jgi:hypothetical protein
MWNKIAYASQTDSIGMPGSLVSDVQSEDQTVFDESGFRRWFAWHRVVIDGSPAWLCWVERRWLDRYHDDGFWEYRRVPNHW